MSVQPPRSAFLDYRSPYAWQNRALIFNKQLLGKLNHEATRSCHATSSKQTPTAGNGRFGACRKLGLGLHRNGPFRHRPLVAVSPSSSSSLECTVSVSTSADEKEETPLVASLHHSTTAKLPGPQYDPAGKMAPTRIVMDPSYPSSRANHNNHHYTPHYGAPFTLSGNTRCPMHNFLGPHRYKHPGPYFGASPSPRYPSDHQGDYHQQHHHPQQHHLPHPHPRYSLPGNPYHLSPYGYMYAGDKAYLSPYGPYFYSSHLYMPANPYLHMPPYLPPPFASKHQPTQAAPPTVHPPSRRNTRSFEYSSSHQGAIRLSLEQTLSRARV